MNKIVLILLFVGINLFAFDYKLTPKKVSSNTWCFLGELAAPSKNNGGFMSNSCYIKTSNSYVLIDSGATFDFAKQAYEAMSQIEKLPVTVVINTHDHDDHWLGSGYYKKRFNAKLFGPSTINTNYKVGDKTRMNLMVPAEIIADTTITKLDEEIKEEKTLIIGNTKIVIIPTKQKAHTSNDLLVYLPESKTMFSGDTVMNGRITSNRDGTVIGQMKVHDLIESKDWNTLVPGHGHNTSKTAMEESKKYFHLLKTRVLKTIEDEVSADKVTSIVTLSEYNDKAMYKELNKRNVFDAYRELEFYEED